MDKNNKILCFSFKHYSFQPTPQYKLNVFNKLNDIFNFEKKKGKLPSIDFNFRGKKYTIKPCRKFKKITFINYKKRIINILGPKKHFSNIKILSTDKTKNTAVKGSKHIAKSTGKAKHNYLVSYMGGIVEIKKNDKVWYNSNGLIIIGWHGSYSPPTLM